MSYSFDNLSPFEFTELVRDLIRVRDGIDLSVTPEGRDDGIDIIRYGEGPKPMVIVQCKHYVRSTTVALVASLKRERVKAEQLSPHRYILATSQPLTPKNKAELLSHFAPLILSADDILCGEDVNALLRDYPEVEKLHYKLWIQSSGVLEKLLSEGTGVWKGQLKSEIEWRTKVYVQTPAFHDALEILNQHRIVIISGSAGIGKSTLAQMLLAKHIQSGFTVHEIESFQDAPKFIPADGEVVLYFDDFLGKSVWRDNASNETEKRLEKLIDLVERDNRLRLVLTTRTYLLEGVRRHSDAGHRNLKNKEGVELKLAEFNKTSRAKILYNHLYFHSVSAAHCSSLAAPGVVARILAHQNFIPRVIESVSKSSDWPRNLEAKEYAAHIVRTLDNPDEIYKPVIQDRISSLAKELVYVMWTWTPERPTVEAVRLEHTQLRKVMNVALVSNRDFESAMKELAGSLIDLHVDAKGEDRCFFLNPGVGDSAKKALWEDSLYWEALVRASTSGLSLYPLALCVPEITNFPGPVNLLRLPTAWYEQWNLVANTSEGNMRELLRGLSLSLALNIEAPSDDWLASILTVVLQKSENWVEDPGWSLLAEILPREHFVAALNAVPGLADQFVSTVRDLIEDYDFQEAQERFSKVGLLGAMGSKAWEYLEQKARRYFDKMMGETHLDEDNNFALYEDEWDELDELIGSFCMHDLRSRLEGTPWEGRPRQREQGRIANEVLPPGELSEKQIASMFSSLATSRDEV